MRPDLLPGQATAATACTVERSDRGSLSMLVKAGATRADMLALFDQGWARVMRIAGHPQTTNPQETTP